MHRQKHSEARRGTSSMESVLGQRSRRLYCQKCHRAVERRHAIHAGRTDPSALGAANCYDAR